MTIPENNQKEAEALVPGTGTNVLMDQYLPENHPLVRASLIEIIFSSLPASQSAIIIGAVFCGFLFYIEAAPPIASGLWVFTVITIGLMRLYLYTQYRRRQPGVHQIDIWLSVFNALALTMGLAWSYAVIMIAPADSFKAVLYATCMLSLISAGAAATLSAVPRTFILFTVTSLGPSVLWLIVMRPFDQQMLGSLMLVYLLFELFIGHRLYRNFLNSILLKLHNETLVKQLQKEMAEQKQARRKLQETEDRYQELFDNASDLVFSVYADGTFAYCNKASAELLGYAYEEFVHMNIFQLLHPSVLGQFKEMLNRGEHVKKDIIILRLLTRDGIAIHIEGSVNIRLTDGKPFLLRGIFRDVTQKIKLEAELQESEKRYKNIVNNAQDIIFTTDLEGNLTYVNAVASVITGYTEQELIGMHYLDLVHPAYRQETQNHYRAKLATSSGDTYYRFPILNRSKELVWLDQSVSLVIVDGKPTMIEAIARDVTVQIQVMEALRKNETYLRAILENIAEAIFTIDQNARILSANPAVEKIFGYAEHEIISKPLAALIPDAPECRYDDQIRLYENIGVSDFIGSEHEAKGIHKNGTDIFLLVCFNEVRINFQVTYTGVVVDITERKKAYNQLLRAKEEAEASRHAEEQFIATVSHEIRTPMSAVAGFIDLLSQTRLEQIQQEYVDSLQLSSQRLLKIVNDLLEFKRIQAGKINFVRQQFNLKSTLDGLINLFSSQANLKGINLSYKIEENVPISLIGDEHRLGQIMQNLISNAIKYTHVGQVMINVQVESVDHSQVSLRITLEDTGVGIPPHKVDHVFDVFEQVEANRDASIGSGLGLSIFKLLVEAQGGSVFVKSELSKGSVFGFTLKFDLDRQLVAAPQAASNFSALLSRIGPVNLLLVDDEPMNIFIALKYLEICDNVHVKTAGNGEKALHEFSRADYDIVLTDANMPVMNGYTFASKVRKDFCEPKSRVPIILVTAELTPHDYMSGAGIDVCLMKPFSREELYRVVYEEMIKHQTTQIH